MPFDQSKYKKEYENEKYDFIAIYMKKGYREIIKAKADELGIPISQLIVTALEKNYLMDLSKDNHLE